jgi:glycosyltransferase involved in cell wall biosynthesis
MKTHKGLVSIIIPTYNQANYLKQALSSVIGQTYEKWEIIVVDNFSTDDTYDVIKKIRDKRIRYFKLRNYGLVAKSRNLGIWNARGQWIAFLDSDDIWHPMKLEIQLNFFNKYDLLCSKMLDFSGKFFNCNFGKLTLNSLGIKEISRYRFLAGNPIPNSSVICKASILKQYKISEDESMIGVEDFDLWMRMANNGLKIGKIKNVLLYYRISKNQLSSSKLKMAQKVSSLYLKNFNLGYAALFTLFYSINAVIRTFRSGK